MDVGVITLAGLDNYAVLERITEMLKDTEPFHKEIRQYEIGNPPETVAARNYPACYVTVGSIEQGRTTSGPAREFGHLPKQEITSEYYIIILVSQASVQLAQKQLLALESAATPIFEKNIQLRDKAGNDPKCGTLGITSVRRVTSQNGKLIDGLTIVIMPKNMT